MGREGTREFNAIIKTFDDGALCAFVCISVNRPVINIAQRETINEGCGRKIRIFQLFRN